MFHVGIKDHIGVQMSSTNIIITDHRYLWNTNTKFSKKWTYPTQFYKCTSNKKVFRFIRKACNNSLLLEAPQNRVAAKVDDISTCRSKFIFITNLISIKKSVKKKGNCDKKTNPWPDVPQRYRRKCLIVVHWSLVKRCINCESLLIVKAISSRVREIY